MNRYEKICIESNPDFSVYHGAGIYVTSEQKPLLHYDDNFAISYMLQGSGTLQVEGKRFPIRSGDVIVTNPYEIHCCNIDDNTYHERISVCINKSVLSNFHFDCADFTVFFDQQKNSIFNVISSEISQNFHLGEILSQILMLSKSKSDKNRILCVCKITEFLNQLSQIASHHKLQPSYDTEEHSAISNTVKYINEHFTQNISCSEIAQKLFINKYYLEHLFKEHVGISLWEYVILKRLLYANELIQQNHSLETASREAGFSNYSNFYRLYKKHFGTTPAEYKKSFHAKNAHL